MRRNCEYLSVLCIWESSEWALWWLLCQSNHHLNEAILNASTDCRKRNVFIFFCLDFSFFVSLSRVGILTILMFTFRCIVRICHRFCVYYYTCVYDVYMYTNSPWTRCADALTNYGRKFKRNAHLYAFVCFWFNFNEWLRQTIRVFCLFVLFWTMLKIYAQIERNQTRCSFTITFWRYIDTYHDCIFCMITTIKSPSTITPYHRTATVLI